MENTQNRTSSEAAPEHEEQEQIESETPEAQTAEEEEVEITEAKGKGYLMEVEKVRETKSPIRLAFSSISSLHRRVRFTERTKRAVKSIQTKAAIKVAKASYGVHEKATKRIVKLAGGKQDKSQLEVMEDEVDAVPTTSPQNELMKDTIEDEDEQLSPAQLTSPFPRYICPPINYELEGATDIDMKKKASTNSNPGSENAGSSCTSSVLIRVTCVGGKQDKSQLEVMGDGVDAKTSEWTLLITSLLVEGISASFDQLGYATTSMVMAFVALLLSIVDLIHKARKEGVAGDGRSLLPRFYRRSSHNSLHWKPFGGLVEYFGVAVQWNSSKSSEQVTCMRGCGAVENGEIEQPNGNYASFSRWARV
ncbi:hypothetical protein POTOM_026471 [Populus tomentosa]|uniref:Uncharacterized protein n=1 Tax=Populus tomentosa TaxID=118781 RepID=A0A8X7ZMY9_POPTO|nr:hypothetical protein POTOM_026471 [Populus tomentosa]